MEGVERLGTVGRSAIGRFGRGMESGVGGGGRRNRRRRMRRSRMKDGAWSRKLTDFQFHIH